METGKRIKLLRSNLGLSVEEVANRLGKNRATVYRYESKDIADVPISVIEQLADILETSTSYLMGWTDDPYDYDSDPDGRLDQIPSAIYDHLSRVHDGNPEAIWKAYVAMDSDVPEPEDTIRSDIIPIPDGFIPLPKTKKVPLLGTIACGEPILAEENIEDYIDMDENIDADFCLRCKGDSMVNARINDGDIVYIRQQPRVEHGQIAAVLVDDEATLKRVYLYEDYITLKPENPAYEPKSYFGERMNDIRIMGKAVAFTSLVK